MDSDSDGYVSSGGEAQLLHQKKILEKGTSGKNKKRRRRSTKAFKEGVKVKYDIDLEDVPNSTNNTRRNSCRCVACGIVKENVTDKWAGHKMKCEGVKHAREKQQLRLFRGRGAELHREKLVDTYMLAYFTYKERLSFTLPSRLQQVYICCLSIYQCH